VSSSFPPPRGTPPAEQRPVPPAGAPVPLRRGRSAPIAVAAAAVALVLGVGAGIMLSQPSDDRQGQAVTAITVAAGDLVVGDCFQQPADPPDDEVVEFDEVEVVRCDLGHDNEAFHAFVLEDEGLPDAREIDRRIDERCIPAFEAFVGTSYMSSELDLFGLWPTEDTWADGDREVMCVLYAMDLSKLEGSAEGSGR
jgi:hypothetical protein